MSDEEGLPFAEGVGSAIPPNTWQPPGDEEEEDNGIWGPGAYDRISKQRAATAAALAGEEYIPQEQFQVRPQMKPQPAISESDIYKAVSEVMSQTEQGQDMKVNEFTNFVETVTDSIYRRLTEGEDE